MLKRTTILGITLGLMVALSARGLQAAKYTVPVLVSDLSTYAPTDSTLGKYYVLKFQVPERVRVGELESAVLELYVDVRAKTRDGYLNGTPVIEVYALKNEFSGAVDLAEFERPSPAIRPLPIGDNKRVILDITAMVKAYLKTPSRNHGLIIGSLSGMREGDFTLRRGSLGVGGVARIHLFCAPRGR